MLETRAATVADAALIAGHRRAMFAAMGGLDEAILDTVCRASEAWTGRMIEAGRYLGWISSDDQQAVASAGMLILDWPPHPFDPSGEIRAYLLNVYVDPRYRRKGLARRLVDGCLAEARRRDICVVTLHASQEGAPLYDQLGFKSTNEMMLRLPQQPT